MPDNPQLAQAYIPYQIYNGIMSPMEGLRKGTVFPELYRPYPGK
ncbi:MAG: spore coat associated protein CotJA [Clostridiaceae bacterium]|nr:spore coat associated protein CotJA [Clostridiaceae bacterium]